MQHAATKSHTAQCHSGIEWKILESKFVANPHDEFLISENSKYRRRRFTTLLKIMYCNTLQHAAICCSMMQHIVKHSSKLLQNYIDNVEDLHQTR